jgi:hypothetical protein
MGNFLYMVKAGAPLALVSLYVLNCGLAPVSLHAIGNQVWSITGLL